MNGVLRIAETKKDTARKDDHDEDSEFEFFLLFNKNYTQVMKFLDRGAKIPTPFKSVEKVPEVNFEWAPIEEVVNVGDYMIIQRFTPFFEPLLSKHGNISAMSTLRPRVSANVYYVMGFMST